jgi:hypothetical protein
MQMQRVIRNQDIAGGLIVLVVAGAFFYLGLDLRYGEARSMGPGYLPRILSIVLLILGSMILVRGLLKEAPPADWPSWRATFVVVLCPIVFGILVPLVGLALSVVVVALIARTAQREAWNWSTFVTPVLLSVFCCIIFVNLLKLPLPIWP